MATRPLDDDDDSITAERAHSIDLLGPSDTSDSGSDMMGVGAADTADPGEPVDIGTRDDSLRSPLPAESVDSGTDSTGTGERRSAAGDAGGGDAPDISVDRIVDAAGAGVDDSDELDGSNDFGGEEEGAGSGEPGGGARTAGPAGAGVKDRPTRSRR